VFSLVDEENLLFSMIDMTGYFARDVTVCDNLLVIL